MEDYNDEFTFKIIIIGDYGVGTTSLLLRFTDDTFTENHLTTGFTFKIKVVNIDMKHYRLQIWHPETNEKNMALPKIYFKGARGIIIAYDITDKNSFNNIKNWMKQIEENVPTNVKKILVGNKCDLPDRKVTEEEGKKLADEYGMNFFETSAKTNQNVNESFSYLIREIIKSN